MRAGSGAPRDWTEAGPGSPAQRLPWNRSACRSSSMMLRRKLVAAVGVGAVVMLEKGENSGKASILPRPHSETVVNLSPSSGNRLYTTGHHGYRPFIAGPHPVHGKPELPGVVHGAFAGAVLDAAVFQAVRAPHGTARVDGRLPVLGALFCPVVRAGPGRRAAGADTAGQPVARPDGQNRQCGRAAHRFRGAVGVHPEIVLPGGDAVRAAPRIRGRAYAGGVHGGAGAGGNPVLGAGAAIVGADARRRHPHRRALPGL